MVRNTLSEYPDFNKHFEIRINYRDFQLVAVIIQEYKSVAFYSIRQTAPQKEYLNRKATPNHCQDF